MSDDLRFSYCSSDVCSADLHSPGLVVAAGRRGGNAHGSALARYSAAGRHTGRVLASLYCSLAVYPQAAALALSPGVSPLLPVAIPPGIPAVSRPPSLQLQSDPQPAAALAAPGPATLATRP